MTDWIKWEDGDNPPPADALVEVRSRNYVNRVGLAGAFEWHLGEILSHRILNQHLIDAARLEGIRDGLEAAARDVWHTGWHSHPSLAETAEAIRLLDPATIAREAVLDNLASEAQEQGMGYEKEADQ